VVASTKRHLLGLLAAMAVLPACRPASVFAQPRKRMKILILGGTKYVGPALVRAALAAGHEVTLFNRGQTRPHLFANIQRLRGDRHPELGAGLTALATGEWDVAFDLPAYYPRLVEASARLLSSRVGRYIMMSSISVYSDMRQIGQDETAPVRDLSETYTERLNLEEGDWSTYGGRKVACERVIASILPGRWASVRACGIIGAGIEDDDPSKLYWPARISQGKPILGPGDGWDALQTVDVRDVADFLLNLAGTNQTGVFNAVGQPTTTGEYIDIVRQVTGGTAPVVWSGRDFSVPMYANEARRPGFQRFDSAKAINAGLKFRSMTQSVQSNWDWFRDNYPGDYDFASQGVGLSLEEEARGLELIPANRDPASTVGRSRSHS
jgi:2'-hydroxyisoflavone reductase